MIINYKETIRSGRVIRWHNNPDMNHEIERNSEHQWDVAVTLLYIFPEASKELIVAALLHDVGEYKTGDLDAMFKMNHPVIAEAHAKVENIEREKIVKRFNITNREVRILKLCDMISAYMRMLNVNYALQMRKDWKGMKQKMLRMADDLFVDTATVEKVALLFSNEPYDVK